MIPRTFLLAILYPNRVPSSIRFIVRSFQSLNRIGKIQPRLGFVFLLEIGRGVESGPLQKAAQECGPLLPKDRFGNPGVLLADGPIVRSPTLQPSTQAGKIDVHHPLRRDGQIARLVAGSENEGDDCIRQRLKCTGTTMTSPLTISQPSSRRVSLCFVVSGPSLLNTPPPSIAVLPLPQLDRPA